MKKTLAAILVFSAFVPNFGIAKPVYMFAGGNISITLTDEECTLKDKVTNLPRRALWVENGKETEGCWGYIQQLGIVPLYFDDKTSTALPRELFQPVSGA